MGSAMYEKLKQPAPGIPSMNRKRRKQGSPGRAKTLFGVPARGLVKGYAKS